MSAKKTETTKPLLGFFKHLLSKEEQETEQEIGKKEDGKDVSKDVLNNGLDY